LGGRKYVIVGFKVDVENSVWYRKFDSKRKLINWIYEHIDEVDFASLRVVKLKERNSLEEVLNNE